MAVNSRDVEAQGRIEGGGVSGVSGNPLWQLSL